METLIPTTIQLSYLGATALFFLGLKKLGSPATARQGNTLAAVGMLIAVVATLLDLQVVNYLMIGGRSPSVRSSASSPPKKSP